MPVVLQLVGRTEARASVAVKPRADGAVAEIAYQEGQPVRKGQLLTVSSWCALTMRCCRANCARPRP